MAPEGNKWDGAWGGAWGTTGAVIVIVIICLAAGDRFLAKVESAEIRNTAQRSYLTGSRLLDEGKGTEAIEALREAHALERQNPEYEVQLITALAAAGKATDAEPLLTDILQREPNDGRANLIAARLMIRKGSTAEAEAYYHRAIYGEWFGDPVMHRVSARMELIDFLLLKNQKQELLAELISLEAEAPVSGEIQKRVGDLFLLAGAPGRAAEVYTALAGKDPNDTAAYEGLGEAELEQGRYREAHEVFLRAFLHDPNNASVRAHLQTLNMVTGLDPTLRQLTSDEKYRRSIRVLEMARAVLDQCVARNPSGNSDTNRQLLKSAEATTAGKEPAHVTNEIAEGVLSLAEMLWHSETTACGGGITSGRPADQNALNLIMNKLAS